MNDYVAPSAFNPIVFPPNPQIGDIFSTPTGKTYEWDGTVWKIISTISPDDYVLKDGDTMTGDLYVTNPDEGTGVIRISGSEQDNMRIRFRKNNVGQWMLDTNETHLRFINYTPDGTAKGIPFQIEADNRTIMLQPQTERNPVEDDDLVRNAFITQELSKFVLKTGDTMTGFLETTMVQIINSSDAILRLSGPHSSLISFRAGGLALQPHWWAGITQDISVHSPDSFTFVRFLDPTDVTSGNAVLMLDYASGDIYGGRFRTTNLMPTEDDELVSKRYADNNAGLQPPGDDGYVYGQTGTGWERVLSLSGGAPNGAMTGPLFLSEDPVNPDQAATKRYVDAATTGQAIFIGVINAPAGTLQLVDGSIIPLPAASAMPRCYGVCVTPGTINLPTNAPGETSIPMRVGDELFSNGQVWILIAIGFSGSITADQTSLTPAVFGATNVQLALQNAETAVDARVLKAGDTMTGALRIEGSNLITRINGAAGNNRATLSFGNPTQDHFHLFRNSGDTLLELDAIDTGGTTRQVFAVNRSNAVLTFLTNPVSSTPTALNQVATKGYVDNALLFAYPQYTTGANYVVDQVVAWDGLLFRVTAAINNAPAVPNFTVLRLMGAPQGDYWRGAPAGWTTGNWIHLLTMAPYGTYRVQFDAFASGADESFILDISVSYNAGRIVISSYAHNSGNFLFDQFRLSANGGNANPVRLEAHIRIAAATPDFKIFVHGFARQNNSNTTVIQKPPTGTTANLGGTQYELLDIEQGTGGGNATPSLVAGTMQVNTGGWIRFPHANTTNRDDGRIAARVHARGLNLVGISSEAADTRRFITLFGHLTLQNNDGIEMGSSTATSPTDLTRHLALWGGATPTAAGYGFSVTGSTLNYVVDTTSARHDWYCGANHLARLGDTGLVLQGNRDVTARRFFSNIDGNGYETFGGGSFYKIAGAGVVIRQSNGNQQPQIENNNGTNRRNIIDTVNGDARYVLRGSSGDFLPVGGGTLAGALTVNSGGIQINAGNFRQKSTSSANDGGQVHSWMDSSDRVTGEIRVSQNGQITGNNHQGSLEFRVNTGGGIQRVAYTRYGAAPRFALDNDPINPEDVATKRYVDNQTGGGASSWETHPVTGSFTGATFRSRFVLGGGFVQIEFRGMIATPWNNDVNRSIIPSVLPVNKRPFTNMHTLGWITGNGRAWINMGSSGVFDAVNISGYTVPSGQFLEVMWVYPVLPA